MAQNARLPRSFSRGESNLSNVVPVGSPGAGIPETATARNGTVCPEAVVLAAATRAANVTRIGDVNEFMAGALPFGIANRDR